MLILNSSSDGWAVLKIVLAVIVLVIRILISVENNRKKREDNNTGNMPADLDGENETLCHILDNSDKIKQLNGGNQETPEKPEDVDREIIRKAFRKYE